MNELKFFAVDGCKVTHPHSAAGSSRFIGYDQVTGAKLTTLGKTDGVPDDGSARVEAILNEVRRDKCLTPADEYTAKRCGLPAPSAVAAAPETPAASAGTTETAKKGAK